MSSLPNCLGNA